MKSGPYSARQFNEMTAVSNRSGGVLWQLVLTADTSFRPCCYLCLMIREGRCISGFSISDNGGVVISDDALDNSVSVRVCNFATALFGLQSLSVFSIERGKSPVPENGASYLVGDGPGSMRYRTVKTHLERCNQCGCAICPFRTHIAGVLCPAGMRQVRHHTFRCVGGDVGLTSGRTIRSRRTRNAGTRRDRRATSAPSS